MTWILGLAAAVGAAAVVIAALLPPAAAALWPGLILMCGVTSLALFRHARQEQQSTQFAGGKAVPPPADDGATPSDIGPEIHAKNYLRRYWTARRLAPMQLLATVG